MCVWAVGGAGGWLDDWLPIMEKTGRLVDLRGWQIASSSRIGDATCNVHCFCCHFLQAHGLYTRRNGKELAGSMGDYTKERFKDIELVGVERFKFFQAIILILSFKDGLEI